MIYKSNWSAWQRIDATICTHWHFLSLTQLALEHYQKVNTMCQYSDILSGISPLFWLKPWCLHCGSRWADSRGARQQAHSKRIWQNLRASFRLSPSKVMVSDQGRLAQVMIWLRETIPSDGLWSRESVSPDGLWPRESVLSDGLWPKKTVPSDDLWPREIVSSGQIKKSDR